MRIKDDSVELTDLVLYQEMIDLIDSYIVTCELKGIEMEFSIQNYTSVGFGKIIFVVMTKDIIDKITMTDEFLILIDDRFEYCEFKISIPKSTGVNPRLLIKGLKKSSISWKLFNEKRFYNYDIRFKKENFVDLLNVFINYLP